MTKAQNDEWTLGGHSFTSRFILGSGKYSMDLIEAAVACAGAQIITLALRARFRGRQNEYSGLYSKRNYPASEYLGSQERGRSRSDRTSCPGGRLRRFRKNRSYPRFQISSAG